jgi:hypothetical protein
VKHINIPEDYIRRKTSTIDFGYELSELDGYLKPIPSQLKWLRQAEKKIEEGVSTRTVAKWLSKKTKRTISHVGLWKHIINKTELEFASLCNKQMQIEGYVYVMINPAWDGWVKVGMAVDPEDRCTSFQTSSPYRDYEIYYSKKFTHKSKAETLAHELLRKESSEFHKEWFKIPKTKAIKLIKGIKL